MCLSAHQKGLQDCCTDELCLFEASRILHAGYRFQPVRAPYYTAYACVLGAFGLSNGPITAKGQAARVRSVLTNLPQGNTLTITPRAFISSMGVVTRVRQRCPGGAITVGGHTKDKCNQYVHRVIKTLKRAEYGVTTDACGLCQTKVP